MNMTLESDTYYWARLKGETRDCIVKPRDGYYENIGSSFKHIEDDFVWIYKNPIPCNVPFSFAYDDFSKASNILKTHHGSEEDHEKPLGYSKIIIYLIRRLDLKTLSEFILDENILVSVRLIIAKEILKRLESEGRKANE